MSATVSLIIKGTSADNYLNNTAASPLYYVRGGYVDLATGSLKFAGNDSGYWPTTIYPTATDAYRSHLSSTNIAPSYYDNRSRGFSAR